MEGNQDFFRAELYTNREESWLLFNKRVLSEARDRQIPLFERLKFLSITASNLDEFFMVRIGSLVDMVNAGYTKKDIAGLSPKEQLSMLSGLLHDFVALEYSTYSRMLLPQMKENGLRFVERHEQLTKEQGRYVDEYFMENVYPVLTPMAVDSSRPFPLIRNKSLNIGALLDKKGEKAEKGEASEKGGKKAGKKDKEGKDALDFATVQVPSVLPRVVAIPSDGGTEGMTVILLEEIIERNISRLFLNYDVVCAHPFRITRNADLAIDEDEAEDLLLEIEKQIKKRSWGRALRLEIEEGADKRLIRLLKKELQVADEDIFRIDGPLDLTFLMKVYGLDGFERQPVPEFLQEGTVFDIIRRKDVLLHHPYQTFAPVVDFIRQASRDPDVLAIKQTLYRVSGNSPIIAALAQAAENGKQVSVLVELKARFDEENNIVWARKLEQAGCHVIYGLVGLKTHSKITLVVRREDDGIRRYVHLGTGNYNDATAKLYTDVGLMTASEAIGEDATAVFNMLSGYSEPRSWNRLSLAPLWLKDRFLYLIGREARNAREGKNARIVAKMNSLCDQEVIAALYGASCDGVKIELIVRGICCLKVGIPGVSENITVRSIVGNFLEHARIFYFENNGKPEYYCSSADWMPRNLERRVEILFPVEDPDLQEKLKYILAGQMKDNTKAHILQPDGSYEKVDRRGRESFCAQEDFCRQAIRLGNRKEEIRDTRRFVPETHAEE